MNVIGALGALVGLAGAALVVRMLWGVVRALIRKSRYRSLTRAGAGQGVFSDAVAARDVYVPGTVTRRLLGVLGGVLVTAVGVLLLAAGVSLDRDFVQLEASAPVPIGTVDVRAQGAGQLRLVYREGDRSWQSPLLPGSHVVVHGEFIFCDEALARVGLTAYQRVTTVASYARPADVFINQPQALYDIRPSSLLWRLLDRTQKHQKWVETGRHFSVALGAGSGPLGLYANQDGYVVRTGGR